MTKLILSLLGFCKRASKVAAYKNYLHRKEETSTKKGSRFIRIIIIIALIIWDVRWRSG